jgi:hypothetical protein
MASNRWAVDADTAGALYRVDDPLQAFLLQELGDGQRVVDGLDCVRGFVSEFFSSNQKRPSRSKELCHATLESATPTD